MKYRSILLSILLILLVVYRGLSQSPPSVTNVIVYATVEHNTNGVFRYNYAIENPSTSPGDVTDFYIDVSKDDTEIDCDTLDLEFVNSWQHFMFSDGFHRWSTHKVPVAFSQLPQDWMGFYPPPNKVNFSGLSSNCITPGRRLDGLEFVSKGLPAIRSYIASPDIDISFYPDISNLVDPDEIDLAYQQFEDLYNSRGFTIGPKPPKINFNAKDFLDTMKINVIRSRSFGWILSETIKQKYIDLFDTVRALLERGSGRSARQTLDAVLENVESDKVAALTTEAYALIRYNTEYLKTHLPTTTR